MTLWLILALMTGAAIFAVIWPLAQNSKAARSGSDVAVYRDQLDEVERDLAAGSIGKNEAEAARVEISRRLLTAADAAKAASALLHRAQPRGTGGRSLWLRFCCCPLGPAALYLRLGSPGLASDRSPPSASATQSAARSKTWSPRSKPISKTIPETAAAGRCLHRSICSSAATRIRSIAWRSTLKLLGESADREANLGEALMAEANGVVTADAKAAFMRAVTLDNTTVSARYYLGTAAEQDGKREEAAKIWRDLIAEAPAGAHWVSDVRAALARVEANPAAPPPGPSAAQIAAATEQSPDQQTAMIRGMVDGLAARLKQDGSDLDGWVRLVRSYKVLGEPDKAQAAISDAQHALANDPDKRKRLDVALKELEGSAAVAPANPPIQPANPRRAASNTRATRSRAWWTDSQNA